jgi:DNA-binding SARP family transcriptional activator
LKAWLGEEPLVLPPSRQSRALLAYLACAVKPTHRTGLCELLWENTPEPRAALRWCLSRLRPVLDAGGQLRLLAEDDNVWIPTEFCEVDGKRLREVASHSKSSETSVLEEAATRFAGPFLADLEVADAFRFENWKIGEEKELSHARGLVFQELMLRYQAVPESTVRLGHIWVQQDPFNPLPHIAIVEALTALGLKREALAHFERCDQMLRRDGGMTHPALEKARANIGRLGRVDNLGQGKTMVTPALKSVSRKPLVGRNVEMERFAELRRSVAQTPDGKIHLLSGEPGIGKTRLLEEMGDLLVAEKWIRFRGRAFEAEQGRAFGPWIDAAWSLASEYPGNAVGFPLLHPTSLPEGQQGDPFALFEAVKNWLLELSQRAPLILIFDDLHWLDSSSVALLQYLMRNPDRPIRLLLASIRSVAAIPNPSVEAFLRLVHREGWIEVWDIGLLDAKDTAALLRMIGSRCDPIEVFASSGGHPLASLALASEGMRAGSVTRASLEAMLDERIRMAGDEGRSILQWASLLGRGLSPALLETLMDTSVHALLIALEKLEANSLVKVEEGKAGMEYLFGHDLLRRRVQESLSAPRSQMMHAHIAHVLKRHPTLSRGWEEVAQHAEAGKLWELAAEACLEAGNHSYRLRAYSTAEGLAIRGLAHVERFDSGWVLIQELSYLMRRLGEILGRFPEGMDQQLIRLVQKAKKAGREETAMSVLSVLATLRFMHEQPDALREAAVELGNTVGKIEEPALRAYSMSDMATCLLITDQEIPRARKLIHEARKICEEHGVTSGMTLVAEGFLAYWDGRLEEAKGLMERSQLEMAPADLRSLQHHFYHSLSMIALELDNPLEARDFAVKMRGFATETQAKADIHFPDALLAMANRLLAEPDAEILFQATLEKLRAENCKVMTAYLLLFWAERDLREGKYSTLADYCHEAIARCEPLKRLSEPTMARCLLGLAALKQGNVEAAKEQWLAMAPALKSLANLRAQIYPLVEELAMGLDLPL